MRGGKVVLVAIGLAVIIGVVGYMAIGSSAYMGVEQAIAVCKTQPGTTVALAIKGGEADITVYRISRTQFLILLAPRGAPPSEPKLALYANDIQIKDILGNFALGLKPGQYYHHAMIEGSGETVVEIKCMGYDSAHNVVAAVVTRVLRSCHSSYSAPQVSG